ncbi:processive 1,2-diacylglycerol beta-glucosyltransferase [Planifilum fimeticola]|jgi:processive 1,2-diacylglycerol beta-glucosyltransferase|uniref:Processive 1,2-diacylglycerol beta-glucosyltransferase n=1 Tax=Planifilum fimeticola TaxID=201975 RepID=A0A2T0LDL3_9BACL|nr:glycosyltransferase [Planifilum fimeticola]PRX40152.1 processive 1,2-diacylglycerol beta-glucosyltransferase [Planifilum fimeticola]
MARVAWPRASLVEDGWPVQTLDSVGQCDILLVSENFGTGHTRAAEAILRGIRSADADVNARLVEIGRVLRPRMSRLLVDSYLGIIRKTPFIWRAFYGWHQGKSFPRSLQSFIRYALYTRLAELITLHRPRLVVSTHPFAAFGVARLKERGWDFKLCTVVTDFSAHGSWAHPQTDRYLVPAEHVRNQLIRIGTDPERILVTGIPTDPIFWEEEDQAEVRRRLGLRQIPTVLIMGGGLGLGGMEQLVNMMAKWRNHMQILVVTGRNHQLYQSLTTDPKLDHPNIRIAGYIQSLSEWMEAADLILTKPGAMTCTEAIAKVKPLLLYGTIPGHEEKNGQFLTRNGLALRLEGEDHLDEILDRFLSDPECFSPIREAMLQWRKKIHPSRSVEAVLQMIGESPASLSAPSIHVGQR